MSCTVTWYTARALLRAMTITRSMIVSLLSAMAWVAGAAPRERRGEMIGTAIGAAVAGALAGPALGTLADAVGITPAFCGVAVVGTLLAAWALSTPPATPEGTSTPRELVNALRDGRVAGHG